MYFVYFIQAVGKENSPVKIGHAKNVSRRLEAIQVGNPFELEIKIQIPFESLAEAKSTEKILHNEGKLNHKHLRGEWFYLYTNFHSFLTSAYKHITDKQTDKKHRNKLRKSRKGR